MGRPIDRNGRVVWKEKRGKAEELKENEGL